jgi:uncharacterized membrane protein YfcA
LVVAALLAGVVDAIAGGGGLLTLPALLATGMPPHLALGTNKGQSVFGSFSALVRFARAGLVDRERARVAFPFGLLGSLLGATLVLFVPPEVLRPLVLVMLVLAGAYVLLRRPGAPRVEAPRPIATRHRLAAAAIIALVIGGYDGFFGPGTGTFLILAFVAVYADTLQRASADAKVVNFASNLAAVALFAFKGTILWWISLPMAAGQLTGGWIGAHLAVKGGDRVVRVAVLLVVLALVLKVARDLLTS